MREGWVETTLGEIAEVVGGSTPKTGVPEYWDGDIPWITPTEVAALDGRKAVTTKRKITNAGLASSSARLLPEETVLFTSRATIGAVSLAATPMATNQGFASFICGEKVVPRFLADFLRAHKSDFVSRAGGNTFLEISRKNVKAFPIALPPLPEQHRIVDLMGAADAYVAAADARVEAARTARIALLTDLLSTPGEDWMETTLGTIGSESLFTDGDWVESKDQDPNGDVRLTQLADIGDGVWLDKSNRFMTSEKARELRCTILEPTDILIARMPDPIGRACLFPGSDQQCVTVVDVAVLRLKPEGKILPQFLVNAINLSATRRQIESLQGGTTRTRVSRGNLATVGIALPPLAEQTEIVETLEAADKDMDSVVRIATNARQLRTGLLTDLLSGAHEIPSSYDRFLEAA